MLHLEIKTKCGTATKTCLRFAGNLSSSWAYFMSFAIPTRYGCATSCCVTCLGINLVKLYLSTVHNGIFSIYTTDTDIALEFLTVDKQIFTALHLGMKR